MRIFKINKKLSIVCEAESTRYGFRHLATLMSNGSDTYIKAKCCYYNRTWERFAFQTVVLKLLNKIGTDYLTAEEKQKFRSEIHG